MHFAGHAKNQEYDGDTDIVHAKSTDMDGSVQTIGAPSCLPENFGVLAVEPCLYDTVADRRALLVREGGLIEQQVTTERPVFATALGEPDRKYLFLCTSDSNDPVLTRQVPGATIDIAEV